MASDKQYAAVFGPVQQFPDKEAVETRVTSDGQKVSDFTVRSNWPGQVLVKVSVFPELEHAIAGLQRGDFVAGEGKYTSNVGNTGKTYHNLTAYSLAVLPTAERADTGRTTVTNPVESPVAPF